MKSCPCWHGAERACHVSSLWLQDRSLKPASLMPAHFRAAGVWGGRRDSAKIDPCCSGGGWMLQAPFNPSLSDSRRRDERNRREPIWNAGQQLFYMWLQPPEGGAYCRLLFSCTALCTPTQPTVPGWRWNGLHPYNPSIILHRCEYVGGKKCSGSVFFIVLSAAHEAQLDPPTAAWVCRF